MANSDFDEGMNAYNKKNYKVALSYFKKSAEQGYTKAQYRLGLMYGNGAGVAKDNDTDQ